MEEKKRKLLLGSTFIFAFMLLKTAHADLAYPYWKIPAVVSCTLSFKSLVLFFFIDIFVNVAVFYLSFLAINYSIKSNLLKFFEFVLAISFFGFVTDFSISKLMQNWYFYSGSGFLTSYYIFSFFVLFFVAYFLSNLFYAEICEKRRLILPLVYAGICNPALGILIFTKLGYYPLKCAFPKSKLIYLPHPKPPIYPVKALNS